MNINLPASQYLELVDEMVELRLRNERIQRDKDLMQAHIQRQKKLIHQINHKQITPKATKFTYSNSDWNDSGDYLQDFKKQLKIAKENICQSISMTTNQQIDYIKEEIKKITQAIKPSQVKNSDPNLRVEQKPTKAQPLEQNIKKPNDRSQFQQKIKFLYSLWNKGKSEPTLGELQTWLKRINSEVGSIEVSQEFNPIRSAKQARRKKKYQDRGQSLNILISSQKAEAKKLLRKSVTKVNLQADKQMIQQMIKNYKKQTQMREGNQASTSKFKSNKTLRNQGQHEDASTQISVLKPRPHLLTTQVGRKNREPEKKQEKPRLKKKSATLLKNTLATFGDISQKPVAKKSASKAKLGKQPSLKKLISYSANKVKISSKQMSSEKQQKKGNSAIKINPFVKKQNSDLARLIKPIKKHEKKIKKQPSDKTLHKAI